MHFKNFDVTIVGGGLAGTLCAIVLQQRGLKTVVIEREGFQRLRSGAWISPGSAKILEGLGVNDLLAARSLASTSIRVLCGRTGRSRVWAYDERTDPAEPVVGWHVARADLDLALAHRAQSLGATVWPSTRAMDAIALDREKAVISVRDSAGAMHEVHSKLVIDATGETRWLAARNNAITVRNGNDGTAIEAHLVNVQPTAGAPVGCAEFVSFAHGSLWLLPLRGGVYTAATSVTRVWAEQRKPAEDAEAFFQRTLRDAVMIKPSVSDAQLVGQCVVRNPISVHLEKLSGPGWIAIGTAAGSVDPALAMDSSLALLSVSLLQQRAESVLAGDGFALELNQAAEFCSEISQMIAKSTLTDALLATDMSRVQRANARALFRMDLCGEKFLAAQDFLGSIPKS